MKRILLIGFFIVLSALVANADDLTFKIALNKDTFYLMEPIYAKWVVCNTSSNPIEYEIPEASDGTLKYYIATRESIEQTSRTLVNSCFIERSNNVLMQKDSISNTYMGFNDDFLELFSLPRYTNNSDFSMLPIGEYKLKATIEKEIFKGQPELKSNQVSFVVVEPPSEEKNACEKFINVVKTHDNNKKIVKLYENYINEFPNSRYSPYILKQLSLRKHIGLHDSEKSKACYIDLIHKYPNHPEACDALSLLFMGYDGSKKKMWCFSSRQEGLEYLKTIADKYPETIVGKLAQIYLMRLKKTGKMFGYNAISWEPIQ
ncbi:MAG: hypothetical protein Q7U71_02570 [bacterium]|nr:hypothetical protein [bacterium]